MPIFRCAGQLHLYAHVPKCGGRSVESYLAARFGPLALLDDGFYRLPGPARWSRTSPQHIDTASLAGLFPPGWIATSFAVVRHPLTRLVSSYNYFRTVLHRIPDGMGIEEWFTAHLRLAAAEPFRFDHHLRPQGELVPEGAVLFRLEDGLDPLVAHLDRLAGDTGGPRQIGHEHGTEATGRAKAPVSAAFAARVASHYAEDFRRFGYGAEPPRPAEVYLPGRGDGTTAGRWRAARRLWGTRLRLLLGQDPL